MPPKNFKNALTGQRAGNTTAGTGVGRLGVVGDAPSPVVEELERANEQVPIQELAIGLLHDNPFQHLARPTLNEEALEELAASIRQNGFYGALLARRKRGKLNEYELAYGHRRREAARRAGLTVLPVKVIELSDTQMARVMASENFSRENLSPLGEANVVGYLSTMQNLSIEEIAEVVGKKRGWVQPRLQLYEAPDDLKAMVEQKPETMTHLRLLKPIKEAGDRAQLVRQVLDNDLTFDQLKTLIETRQNSAIDTNFTISSDAVTSEKSNNQTREEEAARRLQAENALADKLLILRNTALKKLNSNALRFERLAAETNYELSKSERRLLNDIVERLAAILDSNGGAR